MKKCVLKVLQRFYDALKPLDEFDGGTNSMFLKNKHKEKENVPVICKRKKKLQRKIYFLICFYFKCLLFQNI